MSPPISPSDKSKIPVDDHELRLSLMLPNSLRQKKPWNWDINLRKQGGKTPSSFRKRVAVIQTRVPFVTPAVFRLG